VKIADEIAQLRRIFGSSPEGLYRAVEAQFGVLSNRAQVMLGLCGVVITTTGFSGRLIAGTNLAAQISIISGITLILVAAVLVVVGVMPLRWLTQCRGDDMDAWLAEVLTYRNRKLGHYRIAVVLLLLGMAVYVVAIALMLLFPSADALPMMR